jgi:hypothetical protein
VPVWGGAPRARLAPARVRRIWDRIAAAMADIPMRRRDDHLFAGVAHLWAQRRTDPGLLLTAARRAYARTDLGLAQTLARAAQEAGGGWQAEQLLAEALDRNGHYTEAARVLSQPPDGDDVEYVRWAVTQARVLYWGFGQAGEAERVLVDATGRPGQRSSRGFRASLAWPRRRCARRPCCWPIPTRITCCRSASVSSPRWRRSPATLPKRPYGWTAAITANMRPGACTSPGPR